METEFLSVEEVAKYLGLKRKTLYSMCRRGDIPYFKFGRLVKFKKSDVEAWIEGNRKSFNSDKSARDILKSIEKKDRTDIDGIIKKTIAAETAGEVKSTHRKARPQRDPRKEGSDNGSL